MVGDREDIGEHLSGMPGVGQPVPHRHPGLCREDLHGLLGEATVLDAVEHTAEHAGGVLDRLLLAEVGLAGPQVADVRSLVVRGDLERRPGPGGGLLEDQRDVPPFEAPLAEAELLLRPELAREPDEVGEFRRGEVCDG